MPGTRRLFCRTHKRRPENGRRSKGQWFVIFVEDPKTLLLPEKARNRIFDNLRLAEQMGAETFTLTGRHIAEEIITFAGQRKITKIIVGKPSGSLWKRFLLKSPVDKLVRMSGETDVYVISGEAGEQRESTLYDSTPKDPFVRLWSRPLVFYLGFLALFFDVPLLPPQ